MEDFPVEIRRLRQDDRKAAQRFFDSLGEESVSFFNVNHGNEKRTMEFFENGKPDHIFWGAFIENKGEQEMVGLVFVWDTDRVVLWLGIAVSDRWQGMHIGRKMLGYIVRELSENGYGGILLRTAKTNIRGQKLYERTGFERLGVHESGEFLYLLRFIKEK